MLIRNTRPSNRGLQPSITIDLFFFYKITHVPLQIKNNFSEGKNFHRLERISIIHYQNLAFFCVCENTQKNTNTIRKYFSDGVSSKKYPQKYNDRKIEFFCGFTIRNNFSMGLTRTEKLCSPRLKLIFLCVNAHRKKK